MAQIEPVAGKPSFAEFLSVFLKIGCLSFGGPAGQVALMHREIVDGKKWIDEGRFLRALNFCTLLPGPEAQQLATYIGWQIFGLRGGLAAGMLFIIPGALVMLALSLLYVNAAMLPGFDFVMTGVKAAVVAIVGQALLRLARRTLTSGVKIAIAFGSFTALFLFNLSFPLVIIAAGVVGIFFDRPNHAPAPSASASPRGAALLRSLKVACIGGILWAAPVAAAAELLGSHHIFVSIGLFFSKLAVVTFGGAYAVLAYMAQAAVQNYGWLSSGQMADALGLAETTPGPLILVTQFVGFLAGWQDPAPFAPPVAAILASLMVLWVTFVPCFIWIFTFAPWIERLEHARHLHAALSAITAAVVGVIANLALWFALHVMFARVARLEHGPFIVQQPDMSSFNLVASLVAIGATVAMIRYALGPVTVLAGAVAATLLLRGLLP